MPASQLTIAQARALPAVMRPVTLVTSSGHTAGRKVLGRTGARAGIHDDLRA